MQEKNKNDLFMIMNQTLHWCKAEIDWLDITEGEKTNVIFT